MSKLCHAIKHYAPLIARVLLAQLFIVSGLGALAGFARTAAFMANRGLPMPEVLLVMVIVVELGCGLLLLLGWKARWAAAALCGFTFLTAIVFHPFWSAEPAIFTSQLNNFMKNFAIMGGMLYIVAYGPGPLSLGYDACGENVKPGAPGTLL